MGARARPNDGHLSSAAYRSLTLSRAGAPCAAALVRRLNLGAIEASPTINVSNVLLACFSPLLEGNVGPAGSRDIWQSGPVYCRTSFASKCTSAGQSEQHDGDWEAAHPLQEGSEATAQETHAT
jgi:hypothetical protein